MIMRIIIMKIIGEATGPVHILFCPICLREKRNPLATGRGFKNIYMKRGVDSYYTWTT